MKTKVIHQNYRHDITVKLTPKLLVSIIIRDLGELCTATHTGDANTLATARLAASESTLCCPRSPGARNTQPFAKPL